ncbi:hypothetical protein [Conexibacter arvalis]|uniref:Phenylpyruvate tautomerase PptA (4-oxalocrotonate tautomerase family) n=1 Tax=Conexibacter arvalis TaxID=912552 RepID=A0A840ICM8_9ACTN|nr:hypothetical protein [Conexibacter arvalis]MBB4661991.1 phenylpyruvate tautomerase PptA (4-oxalocrotonate tautomerase family) [Conexibacter arvalis]
MPKADLTLSPGALPADAIGPLTDALTGLLLRHRGVEDTPRARANVWWFVDERQAFVAGAAPALPLVVVRFAVIAGGIDDAAVAALVADGTAAVKAINPDARVWLIVDEVADGRWGVEGRLAKPTPKAPAAT